MGRDQETRRNRRARHGLTGAPTTDGNHVEAVLDGDLLQRAGEGAAERVDRHL